MTPKEEEKSVEMENSALINNNEQTKFVFEK